MPKLIHYIQVRLSNGEESDVVLYEYIAGRQLRDLKEEQRIQRLAKIAEIRAAGGDVVVGIKDTVSAIHRQQAKWVRISCTTAFR